MLFPFRFKHDDRMMIIQKAKKKCKNCWSKRTKMKQRAESQFSVASNFHVFVEKNEAKNVSFFSKN